MFSFSGLLAYAWLTPDFSDDSVQSDSSDYQSAKKSTGRRLFASSRAASSGAPSISSGSSSEAVSQRRLSPQRSGSRWNLWHRNGAEAAKKTSPIFVASVGQPNAEGSLQNLQRLLAGISGSSTQEKVENLMKLDKHVLWDRYGHYFASKDEAKAAYEQFKSNHQLPSHLPDQ